MHVVINTMVKPACAAHAKMLSTANVTMTVVTTNDIAMIVQLADNNPDSLVLVSGKAAADLLNVGVKRDNIRKLVSQPDQTRTDWTLDTLTTTV